MYGSVITLEGQERVLLVKLYEITLTSPATLSLSHTHTHPHTRTQKSNGPSCSNTHTRLLESLSHTHTRTCDVYMQSCERPDKEEYNHSIQREDNVTATWRAP